MANMNLSNIEGTIVRFISDKVEAKVKASTTAATIAAFVPSLAGSYVFHGAAPNWVQVAVSTVVTGALTFAAGWLARHTPRTVPAEQPPAAPAPPVRPATPAAPSNPTK